MSEGNHNPVVLLEMRLQPSPMSLLKRVCFVLFLQYSNFQVIDSGDQVVIWTFQGVIQQLTIKNLNKDILSDHPKFRLF